jgi:predicted nucleic acid-binding protein
MGRIDALKGKRVAVDTAPFIYFIEKHPRYVDLVRAFIKAVNDGEITAFTSVMTLLETLVVPLKRGDQKLVQQYRDILSDAPNFTTVAFVSNIAEEAARLRAVYNIRTPDAVQIATAVIGNAAIFLTNDMDLPVMSELQIITLDDLLMQGSHEQSEIKSS